MKEFFARLNPTERRFVVGVAVVFFLVANMVWVWPHYQDWGQTTKRMKTASDLVSKFENTITNSRGLDKEIEKYRKSGSTVPQVDRSVDFLRLIQNQSVRSGVQIITSGGTRQTGTNQFFVEQIQTLTLQSPEKQLVDFLYNIGSGDSMIRVRDLSVQPDPPHQQLVSRVTLVASYQKSPAAAAAKPGAPRNAAPAQKPATPAATPKPAGPPPAAAPKTIPPKPGVPVLPGQPGRTNALKTLTPNKK